MIPQAYISEWSRRAPWSSSEQIEQDLVISRAIIEIFSDEWLGKIDKKGLKFLEQQVFSQK